MRCDRFTPDWSAAPGGTRPSVYGTARETVPDLGELKRWSLRSAKLSVVCHSLRRMRPIQDKELGMIIDCDSCVVRGLACEDCVVSVLLGVPENVEIDVLEQRAIDALGRAGIVPRLRLAPTDRSA